ncbi:MAG: sigma-70 family RNA polymerase sigma factor [Clostridiales bacterium]|nr:sigma-70 family RNA polymerase sigma factor [Clostridiales bacterium]
MYTRSDDHIFFEEHIQPHYFDILKFLTHSTSDEWIAHDVVQNTMEDAWKYIKRLRTYDNVKAGLIAMSKNNLKKYYKKHSPEWLPIERFTEPPSIDQMLEEIIMATDTFDKLTEMFAMLDETSSRILILHHYYKVSLRQIADILGKNYNTVLSWHNRAIKKLREIA